MKSSFILLASAGALFLLFAISIDTTVYTDFGKRVHNLGLMQDQSNYIIISAIMIFTGLLGYFFHDKGSNSHSGSSNDSKVCPFCAEVIKSQAIVCRYCNHPLELENSVLASSLQENLNEKENIWANTRNFSEAFYGNLKTKGADFTSDIMTRSPKESLNEMENDWEKECCFLGTLYDNLEAKYRAILKCVEAELEGENSKKPSHVRDAIKLKLKAQIFNKDEKCKTISVSSYILIIVSLFIGSATNLWVSLLLIVIVLVVFNKMKKTRQSECLTEWLSQHNANFDEQYVREF